MTIILTCLASTVLADEATSREKNTPADRGQLLYENHCKGCHQPNVHIRDTRMAKSASDVQVKVRRWSEEISLNWDDEDVAAVTRYLVRQYYKFDIPSN